MTRDELARLYRQMLTIRRAEERLQKLFADGLVPGFLHLSIGQEAVPVGVSSALTDRDTVSSNHRGHGHTLAKGVDLEGFFAEILGRATGLCKGRGGSMHVADLGKGMLGANGIVGAGLPITTGSALALKMQGEGHVAVVYFGDGALAEGVLHECLNIAALWQLPILFVCENNGWSEFSPTERQLATSLDKLAGAFAIRYAVVDGNRVAEVATAAGDLVAAMRKTPAPAVLECATTRIRGHFEGDRQEYRDSAEIAALAERDPIRLCAQDITQAGGSAKMLAEIAEAVAAEIDAAAEAALGAPLPRAGDILADVYTTTTRAGG
ncbi:MAG: thiamine pyrophosphate-dependent dehydrogenase E1 component subunit alpha [Roseovarius sp.]|nr:thiamine pyrophosphate-dependent dehydrogenase E1 component subunit alpha [Roseovarius sp.]